MAVYALRRILWTIPIVLLVVTLAFFATRAIGGTPLQHAVPPGLGTPAWVKYGDNKPDAIWENMERRYGLDRPWYEQYAAYLRGLATLDLGPSLTFRNRSVSDIVVGQGTRTLELIAFALVVALVFGVGAGLLSASRRGSVDDVAIRAFASGALSVPSFLVATLLIYVCALKLGWFPTSGWGDWRHKVLPVVTLSLVPMAWCMRLTRGAVLDAAQAEHVRAARARGLRRRRVFAVHVVRSALIPVVTILGPLVGFLITGAFVVEAVFSIPGAGRYFVAAVVVRDYPVVFGLTSLLSVTMVLVNLGSDLLHGALDPRVREAATTRVAA